MSVSVLVVEDVDLMRNLLAHVLSGIEGIAVSGLARNGWDARVELTRRRPDLILLDEILPGESCTDLVNEFSSQGVPVLLLTGMQDPRHAIPPGASGRLAKPGWDTVEADRLRMKTAIFAALRSSSKT